MDSGALQLGDRRATWHFLVLSAVLLTVLALLEWQTPSSVSTPVALSPEVAQTKF